MITLCRRSCERFQVLSLTLNFARLHWSSVAKFRINCPEYIRLNLVTSFHSVHWTTGKFLEGLSCFHLGLSDVSFSYPVNSTKEKRIISAETLNLVKTVFSSASRTISRQRLRFMRPRKREKPHQLKHQNQNKSKLQKAPNDYLNHRTLRKLPLKTSWLQREN